MLTDPTGTVTDTYDYDAFGNMINLTGNTPNNYLYRGEQFDPDLGLYYLRARYYNPFAGTFTGRDSNEGTPRIPATLHKYLYTGGDPVNRIDPRGRADEEEEVVLNLRSPTKSEAYAAEQLGFEKKIIGDAIHALKRAVRGSLEGNPDVWIDITNGNVYLQILQDEQIEYELLDNLFEYLP